MPLRALFKLLGVYLILKYNRESDKLQWEKDLSDSYLCEGCMLFGSKYPEQQAFTSSLGIHSCSATAIPARK